MTDVGLKSTQNYHDPKSGDRKGGWRVDATTGNGSKRTSKSTPSKKRGKESAAVLVDRALSDGSLPEHIIAKRDSIIAEVEKGRSVHDTIALMRTIFG